jgi:hypothetical protein
MMMDGDVNTTQETSQEVIQSSSIASDNHKNYQDSNSSPIANNKFLQNLAGVAGNALEWYDFGEYRYGWSIP